MKIKKVIKGVEEIEIKGSKDLELRGLSSHSKLVQPKDLFFVRKSKHIDCQEFIDQAIESGASAILTDMYNPFLKGICQLIHPEPEKIHGQIANNFYAHTNAMRKFFVTGTNGKTTTCFMLKHLLEFFKQKTGLLTTICRIVGQNTYGAKLTTDDLITNYKDFHLMHGQGCMNAVVEASSHGLDQARLDQIPCQCAVFTNLSHEHLDYHTDMQEYLDAKLKLLHNLQDDGAVIFNLDCPYFSKAIEHNNKLSFSLENAAADLRVVSFEKKSLVLEFQGAIEEIFFDVLGEYNVQNALAAILALLSQGFALPDFKEAFKGFCLPKGRLEKVKLACDMRAYIDFAHTPEALRVALKALEHKSCGKLFLVFGCGGNRDTKKRAQMTQIACQYADHLVFTSDNPRDEDPIAIIDAMKKGLDSKTPYDVVVDRRAAIVFALEKLQNADTLLISGKGHEQVQIIQGNNLDFDDKSVVQKWVKDLDLVHV